MALLIEPHEPPVMRVANDDAIILQPHDALRFSKLHIEHLPLPQQRALRVVNEHAPGGVHHREFVVRPGRETARSRLHRAICGEHPCAPGFHGNCGSVGVILAASKGQDAKQTGPAQE